MKRVIKMILFCSLIVLGLNQIIIKGNDFSLTTLEYESKQFDGVSHFGRTVNMELKDKSKQKFNVLEFDNKDDNIHLVTISNYINFKWGMTPLEGMIIDYQDKNPNLEVLGGVNGDFYDINNTGHPNGTYIENYEVIKGTNNRTSFNIRSDGTYDIGRTLLNGREVVVISADNEIKFREKLDKFNQVVTTDTQVGLYLESYKEVIDDKFNPVLINGIDIKYTGSTFERAKGKLNNGDYDGIVPENKFVLVGKKINEIIEPTDTILVQYKIDGFENVRGTMGGGDLLVTKGEVDPGIIDMPGFQQRAPRTIVGIKPDGSVFFVVANGRDEIEGIPGPTIEESGYLAKFLGAETALNIDGGGSSTMMARNFDGTFTVLNKLSDGRMRSVSNGILIVRGDVPEQPIHIKGEDLRSNFLTPTNIFIDFNNNLRFDNVVGATRYVVTINGNTHETSKGIFSLNNLTPGDYEIKVKAKSNLNGKASENSEVISFKVKEYATNQILDWLNNFTRNKN